MMSPMLQSWINQFSSILEHPVQSEDPADWSIRMEVDFLCFRQKYMMPYLSFFCVTDYNFPLIRLGYKVLESVPPELPESYGKSIWGSVSSSIL